MVINKLEIENFGKTVEKQTLEFKKGINLICGNNGEGKSNALKALSLLLFNYSKGRHQDYINWDKDSFKTSLDLEHLGNTYDIKFSVGARSEGKLLTINGNDYYERSEANDRLAQDFNPKLMLASMISFEGETDLITVKPAERREHLKKIYDLDFKYKLLELKNLIDTLNDKDIAEIEKEILILQSVEYDINELIPLPFSHDDYLNYKDLSLSNNERIKKSVEINQKKQQLITNLAKFKDDGELANNNLNVYNASLTKLQTEPKKEVIDYDLKLSEYKEKLDNLNDDNVKLLEASILTLRKKRPIIIDENLLPQLTSEAGVLLLEINTLRKKISDLENGVCPTCGGEIESSDISTWKLQLEEKIKESDIKKLEIADHKVKITEAKAIDDLNLEVKEKTDHIKNDIEKLKVNNANDKKTLESSIKHEEENIKTLKENVKLEKEIRDNKILDLKQKVVDCLDRIANINTDTFTTQDEIDACEFDDVGEIEKENETITSQIVEYDRISTGRDLTEKKNKSEELRRVENEKLQQEKTIKRDQLSAEVAEYIEQKDILNKRFPSYVIATLIKTIEHEMNDFIIKTYEGKYKIKILEKKDAIYVVYGKKEVDVALASGYEKQVFSLAYKHALNKISGTGVLILDEVDSASSIENSIQLYKIVGSMTDLYQQIIIITHKPEVQELLINEYNTKAYEVINGSYKRIA